MSKTKLLFIITILLFTLPFIFSWNNNLYLVGGDDTLLYYLFPMQMIKNYLFNIVSDNVLSGMGVYGTQAYMVPFFLLIYLIKLVSPGINTQLLFYGLNLALGFLFFYALLGLWIENKNWFDFWLKIVSSLFYVFSIFTFYTLWKHQLFSLYVVSITPVVFYLFMRGIKQGKPFFVIGSALILSIFSILLLSAPWSLALVLANIPVLMFLFWQKKKSFMRHSILLLVSILVLNFYWLFHLVYSPLSSDRAKGDIVSVVTNSDFTAGSSYIIREVAANNGILYPLFNLYHKNIQKAWDTYPIFLQWHLKFLPLNGAFLLVILIGGLYARKSRRIYQQIYLVSLTGWLITLFLFTVKIGKWGMSIFLWLNENVPGFVMFRNMYDKFGFAMSFSYAFLLCISLKVLLNQIAKDNLKKMTLLFVVLLVLVNAKPFILGEYLRNPMWTTKNTYNTISKFNTDFLNLVSDLSSLEGAGKILWLPLNIANYAIIQDENLSNHFYSGSSPLLFLTRKNDLSGFLSFENGGGQSLRKELEGAILDRRYDEVGRIFQRLNVQVIIVNKTISPDLQQSYLYGQQLYESQGSEFQKVLLGRKIKDFGDRYSLYEINDNFKSEKIYLDQEIGGTPRDIPYLNYQKLASYKYEVQINQLRQKAQLIFLDPYHKQWGFYFKSDDRSYLNGVHEVVFNYANEWQIDPKDIFSIEEKRVETLVREGYPKLLPDGRVDHKYYIKNKDGSIDVNLTLFFKPQRYLYYGILVSGLGWLIASAYMVFLMLSKRKLFLKP